MDVAHLGARFSAEHNSAGLMTGLDIRVLFQEKYLIVRHEG